MWIRFSLSLLRIFLLCSSISAMYSIYIAYHYSRDIHSPLMESPLWSFFKTLFYRFSFICISTISPSNHSSYSQEEYASKSTFYRNLILTFVLYPTLLFFTPSFISFSSQYSKNPLFYTYSTTCHYSAPSVSWWVEFLKSERIINKNTQVKYNPLLLSSGLVIPSYLDLHHTGVCSKTLHHSNRSEELYSSCD